MIETPITLSNIECTNANIYIKRDDLIPFSFGGNKVRIAEEVFSDMMKKGMNCIVGYGNARSNLSRVLASMSKREGVVCHIITSDEEGGSSIHTYNSRIVHASGAVIHHCNKTNVAQKIHEVMLICTNEGYRPYYIYGDCFGNGNNEVLVRAYQKTYQEIAKQAEEMNVKFDHIFCATGTGMTQAGLIVTCPPILVPVRELVEI